MHTFKKHILTLPLVLLTLFAITSCVDEEEMADTQSGNIEALWKIMDEHYCFFSLKKQELGVDWDEVHQRYPKMVEGGVSTTQLFEVCANMLGELKDGHVNLTSSFDYARNWSWHEDYPQNFSDSLERRYLGTDYRYTCGLKYRILDDNIGYIRCSSFENEFGEGNLDDILYYLATCNALIIDIRNNGGGELTMAERLAQRFTNQDILVGYMQHKTGTGHDDFSAMEEQRLSPPSRLRWQKRCAVLTNRSVFSAANEFVKYMKACGDPSAKGLAASEKSVIVVGDHTGGGAGMPFSSELPNGWAVRFSACPMFDRDRQSTEQGISPDYSVSLLDADVLRGEDTIIETARTLLSE